MKTVRRPRCGVRGAACGVRGAAWMAIAATLVAGCLLVTGATVGAVVNPGPKPQAQALSGATPRRIISLIPSVTEMLFAIGAGDTVVGVSNFDHYPPAVEARTRVGGLIDPDFERILSLRPDLVIVYGTQGELIQRLVRAHVPVFNYEHAGVPDITRTLRLVGERVGRTAAADRLAAEIEGQLAALRARTATRPKPRTMVVFEREAGTLRGMYASGNVGFLRDMLEIAGGANVFADVNRQSLQVTAELLLARAPDVILEIESGPGWTDERIARERSVWRTLASVPAVRSGKIYLLTDEMMSIPGPRVANATLAMAKVLHPEVFQK
jgi:iron complex transport system substrate-binding protein